MSPPKCRILCVDDHADTCLMLSALLGSEGYEVSTAGSIADAKRAVSGEGFDLAILDNRFADGSGVELCAWVRERAPDTPVIIYSGAASQSDRDEGMRAGAAGYVFKPDIGGLVSAVNGLLKVKECAAANTT